MDHVRFRPWIGNKYEAGNRFGKRVLVLGESHYGDWVDANEDFTTFIMRRYGMPVGGGAFFAKVVKVLLQMDVTDGLTAKDRAETWQHVAFYNYVQELVGDEARQRPTNAMWIEAERPFLEVVDALRPHVILALGNELIWVDSCQVGMKGLRLRWGRSPCLGWVRWWRAGRFSTRCQSDMRGLGTAGQCFRLGRVAI